MRVKKTDIKRIDEISVSMSSHIDRFRFEVFLVVCEWTSALQPSSEWGDVEGHTFEYCVLWTTVGNKLKPGECLKEKGLVRPLLWSKKKEKKKQRQQQQQQPQQYQH